jgi:hypothetical protein
MKSFSAFKFLAGACALCFILISSGCNKEQSPTPTNTDSYHYTHKKAAIGITDTGTVTGDSVAPKDPVPAYYLSGQLDTVLAYVTGTPNYYASHSGVQGGDNDSVGDVHSNNGHGNAGDNNGNGNFGNSSWITGGSWSTTGSDLKTVINGSIEMRRLSVRIYVAPITTGSGGGGGNNWSPNQKYYSMLAPGLYGFATPNDPNNGAYVTIRDSNGILWTTMGDQTGSWFMIMSRGANNGTYAEISGVLSAKLYDGQGHMKLFTNASFDILAGLQ